VFAAVSLVAALALPTAAFAVEEILVGYADGIRSGGFFPNPWDGDLGITFLGGSGSGVYDAGAILVYNSGGPSFTVTSAAVSINGTDATLPWALPVTLSAGQGLILAQTADYNFDTSDIHPISPNGVPVSGCAIACPVVTINGVAYLDTGHVLDTNGYDYAYNGNNESFRWRLIGTSGAPGAPEPSTWAMMLLGFGGLGFAGYRARKSARAVVSA
jgi:hypothetical protein